MNRRIVTDISGIDRNQWEQFVFIHPHGNVFQTPQMFDVYELTPHYHPMVLACFDKDELKGILLAVIQKEYKGLLGKLSARSIIWGGPLAYTDDVKTDLLRHYNQKVKDKAIYSQIRNLFYSDTENREPYELNGFTHEGHLNILIDLTVGLDEFWQGVKSNRKRGINKAKRQGFDFEVTADPTYLESFYSLLKKTYKNIKLPIPDKEFFFLLNSKMPEHVKWFILKKNDEPIIILLALNDKKTIRPFYIGGPADPEVLNLRPTDIFHYKVICWAIENGFDVYDWMGAGKPGEDYGVREFKMQYGGALIEMGRFVKIHKPLIMRLSKSGFRCWQKIKR